MNRPGDEPSLRTWAAELEAAAKIARDLAPTAFLPPTHRRYFRDDHGRMLDGKDNRPYRLDLDATTATAAAAIMRGWELGLPPGAALASISVINDTPALSALALRAILQTNGHDIWVLPESNATRAIVRARRAGSDDVQESTWTLDRARTAGLYPAPEFSQWRKNPGAMLIARATAEAARWVAADAILGIPYIVEELIDALEGDRRVGAACPRARAAVGRRPGPEAGAPQDAGGPARAARGPGPARAEADPLAARPVPDTPAEMITEPQRRRLHATFQGHRARRPGTPPRRAQPDKRLARGPRPARSSGQVELTIAEARIVLENLDKMLAIAAQPDGGTAP